ncbi:MAG: DegT/DnrJ/EryC1/StrS family aminotransferase [Litorilinea sp.]
MRYLAPTAFPVGWRDVAAALHPQADAMQQLRQILGARLGVPALYPVASGRTALALLLRTLAQTSMDTGAASGSRREVLLPAYTCPSLIRVILDAGLTPHLVDLEPERLTFAPEDFAARIGSRTLAVIFVHPFGLALDVEPILTATRAAGAILIEDAAQALGAQYGDRAVGTRGDFGIFSTGPGKPLALGGGGYLSVNSAAATGPGRAAVARLDVAWQDLATGGLIYAGWSVAKLALVGLLFHPWGWAIAARAGIARAGDSDAGQGYAMRQLTRGQAQAARHMLEKWEATNRLRRANAAAQMDALAAVPGFRFPARQIDRPEPGKSGSIYLRLPVLAADEALRNRTVVALQAQGIGAGKMYGVTLAERYPELGVNPQVYPGALRVAQCLFTLPTHHYVAAADRERVAMILATTT